MSFAEIRLYGKFKKIILTIYILNEYAKTLNYSIDEILNIFKNQEIRNEAKN